MPLPSCRVVVAALLLALPATAQFTHVLPYGFANSEGNTSNAFPWSSTSTLWGGLRTTCVYDSSNFTNASITQPIRITRLRWRANGGASGWTGGSFLNGVVQMATAAVDYGAVTTNIGATFGPDLTTVYTGPVVVQAGVASTPGPWIVDVALAAPFVYDPARGDLVVDVDISNANGANWTGGTTPQLDVDSAATTRASRIFASTNYPAANGTGIPHGVVVEVTYGPAQGNVALATPYGTGCYAPNGPDDYASAYESFATSAAFDLANSGFSMFPTGSGYAVLPAVTGFLPPSPTATVLSLGDDSEASMSLSTPFPYPGGTAAQLFVCSNGFVSVASGNGTGFAPSAAAMLSAPVTAWWNWHDYNPTAVGSGQVKFEEVGGIAYVTFDGVYDFGGTSAAAANTFQFQFDLGSGAVHVLFGAISTLGNARLVGYSPGGPSDDPGSRDLSASIAQTFTLPGRDRLPLLLAASARPLLGTTLNLTTQNLPTGTAVGATILGLVGYDPGLPLAPLGAGGCAQYVRLDLVQVFVAGGSSSALPLSVPNNSALNGHHVYCQATSFSPGFNTLGMLFSNGIDLLLNPN